MLRIRVCLVTCQYSEEHLTIMGMKMAYSICMGACLAGRIWIPRHLIPRLTRKNTLHLPTTPSASSNFGRENACGPIGKTPGRLRKGMLTVTANFYYSNSYYCTITSVVNIMFPLPSPLLLRCRGQSAWSSLRAPWFSSDPELAAL